MNKYGERRQPCLTDRLREKESPIMLFILMVNTIPLYRFETQLTQPSQKPRALKVENIKP
jgi:hypothetical protein